MNDLSLSVQRANEQNRKNQLWREYEGTSSHTKAINKIMTGRFFEALQEAYAEGRRVSDSKEGAPITSAQVKVVRSSRHTEPGHPDMLNAVLMPFQKMKGFRLLDYDFGDGDTELTMYDLSREAYEVLAPGSFFRLEVLTP